MKRIWISILHLLLLMGTSPCWSATLRTEIIGVEGPLLKNVTDQLSVISESYGSNLTTNQIQTILKNIPSNIKKALEPFGYFKAEVNIQVLPAHQVWIARVIIHPGPPLLISRVKLQLQGPGKDNSILQKFIRDFPIQPGQRFDAEQYEKAKQTLFETAHNQGYLKANMTQNKIEIDLKAYTANIIIDFATGERYYFGPITFKQEGFSEEFLRRFLPFNTHDPFSSEKLLTFQQNLNSSQYFQQVNVTPLLDHTVNEEVPINVLLTPNKSQQYKAGLGYGTFTGPRITLGANLRHLTDTGHHMNMELRLSTVLSGLAAQYIIPGKNPLTDQYAIGANAQKFTPKSGNSIAETLFISHTKGLKNDWKRTIMLSYLRERYDIFSDPPSHNSRLLIPSLNFSQVKVDNLLDTRHGHKINFIVRGASEAIVSNTSFAQAEIKGSYIFSLTDVSRVLLRGDLGYTVVNDLTRLPLTLRFFAGGIDSVRGFPFSSIGPGRYLKTASVEYQHQIKGDWHGAVFYDAGTAANHFNNSLSRSVGVGVIYRSLIGPIKVYVAHRETTPPTHTGFGIEFSIGSDL